jgi:hypothetical protein
MQSPLHYKSIRTTKAYDDFLNALYMNVNRNVGEIEVPPIQVISVSGNEPPATKQYQDAVAVLYGIGYGLKMGLKFGRLPKPKGYFDYRVGALGTFWGSTGKTLAINDPTTLRWQAYLIVPGFVSKKLVDETRGQAKAKHPEIPYERASLDIVNEGRSVQMLHVGPYDAEQPTIDQLQRYIADHALAVRGRHHEIYLSDPRRTKPMKLKTVIRFAVTRDAAALLAAAAEKRRGDRERVRTKPAARGRARSLAGSKSR